MACPIATSASEGARSCASVLSDNFDGAYEATRHLIEQGHREIAIIVPEHLPEAVERFAGYRKALEDRQIPFNPELVVRGEYTSSGDVPSSTWSTFAGFAHLQCCLCHQRLAGDGR